MASTFEISNFSFGLDTRRSEYTSKPGVLQTLQNAHINQGGEIEKRKAFAPIYLPANTFGMLAALSSIYVFGSATFPAAMTSGATWIGTTVTINILNTSLAPLPGTTITLTNVTAASGNVTPWQNITVLVTTVTPQFDEYEIIGHTSGTETITLTNTTGSVSFPLPTPFVYQQLTHPSGGSTYSMTAVQSATLFDNKPFVCATFSDGGTYCYYNGVLVEDFLAGLVTAWSDTDAQIAQAIEALVNATGSSPVSGELVYTANVTNSTDVNVISTATQASTNAFTATVTTDLQSGSTGSILANLISLGTSSTPAVAATGSFQVVAGVPSTQATGTVTFTNQPNPSDSVTINGTPYFFASSPIPNVANYVLIGANTTATAQNFSYALNGTGGTVGTDYSTPTVANPYVTASPSTNVVTLTAITGGTPGNSISMATSDATNISLSGATLSGGSNNNYFSQVNVNGTNILSANVPYASNAEQTAINLASNIALNSGATGWTASASNGTVTLTSVSGNPQNLNGLVVETVVVGQICVQGMSFVCDSVHVSDAINSIVVGSGPGTTITNGTITSATTSTSTWASDIAANISGFSGTSGYTAVPIGSTVYMSPLTSASNSTPATTTLTPGAGTATYNAGPTSNMLVTLSTYSLNLVPQETNYNAPPFGGITATVSGGVPPYTYQWTYTSTNTNQYFTIISPTSATTQFGIPAKFSDPNAETFTCTVTDSASPRNVVTSSPLVIISQ